MASAFMCSLLMASLMDWVLCLFVASSSLKVVFPKIITNFDFGFLHFGCVLRGNFVCRNYTLFLLGGKLASYG